MPDYEEFTSTMSGTSYFLSAGAGIVAGKNLGVLSLSANTFTTSDAPGTVIGSIIGLTAGSTVDISPNDGRVAISGTNLVVGLSASSAGSFNIGLRETLAGANGSPKTTSVALTVGVEVLGGFSELKQKLRSGNNATLFVNGDSTSYSDYGPYYKFAAALGDIHNATVVLYRWAEWDGAAPNGPKAYAAPVTLRSGTAQTLTVYLAALPGQVMSCMFDGSRRPNAIDAIPTPDSIVHHHGHNMQTFEMPLPTEYGSGSGVFLGPIGMTSIKWPLVPQVIVTQNPWRDDDSYAKLRIAQGLVNAALPSVGLVDSYKSFIDAGKTSSLYRDNIHPSDTLANSTGAQLVCDVLVREYNKTKTAAKQPTVAWPYKKASSLILNPDFSNWTGSVPANWLVAGAASVSKDTSVKFGSAPYSLAIVPNADQSAALQKIIGVPETSLLQGKKVSIAMLAYAPAGNNFYAAFAGRVQSPPGRTFNMTGLYNCRDGWMWYVASGIQLDATFAAGLMTITVLPSFNQAPVDNQAVRIQKIMLVEGDLPLGGLTSIALSLSSQSLVLGQSTTLTATIVDGLAPTGTVSFYNGATLIATAPVSGGAASYSYTPAAKGSQSITAVYNGDIQNDAIETAVTTLTITAAPFATDTFTGTDGTLLTTHTSGSGHSWALQPTATTPDVAPKLASGRIYNAASAGFTVPYKMSAVAPSADYYVEATIDCISELANENTGITGRADAAANTFYFLRYQRASAQWQLYKNVAGSATILGTYSQAFTIGQSRVVRLTMNGTNISCSFDGVQQISITDSAIAGPGSPGVRFNGATAAAGTGTQITKIEAAEL